MKLDFISFSSSDRISVGKGIPGSCTHCHIVNIHISTLSGT
jgi:hypothetical protein